MVDSMSMSIKDLASVYATNAPFPHIVLKNIWDDAQLGLVAEECDKFTNWEDEKFFLGSVGKRTCSDINKLPKNTADFINYCNGPRFLRFLEGLTGERGLIPDPYLYGGGIHSTINKGFLKLHADFNWHERLGLYRRLNVLIYLNRDWDKSWGGGLDLAYMPQGQKKLVTEATIMPDFNKTVIFTTTDSSYHGHPDPMRLPEGRSRNSIALYYYLSKKPSDSSQSKRLETKYMLRPKQDLGVREEG